MAVRVAINGFGRIGRLEEMIQKGIALGLTRMCFTEHHDLDYPVTESTPASVNLDIFM